MVKLAMNNDVYMIKGVSNWTKYSSDSISGQEHMPVTVLPYALIWKITPLYGFVQRSPTIATYRINIGSLPNQQIHDFIITYFNKFPEWVFFSYVMRNENMFIYLEMQRYAVLSVHLHSKYLRSLHWQLAFRQSSDDLNV